ALLVVDGCVEVEAKRTLTHEARDRVLGHPRLEGGGIEVPIPLTRTAERAVEPRGERSDEVPTVLAVLPLSHEERPNSMAGAVGSDADVEHLRDPGLGGLAAVELDPRRTESVWAVTCRIVRDEGGDGVVATLGYPAISG